MSDKKTTEQFISQAREIHGDKYDYSKVEYVNHRVYVEIICPKHGSFWQRPDVHISQKSLCPKCRGRAGVSIEERFWSKVDKNGPQIPYMPDRCWEWIGGKMKSGYGGLKVTGHYGDEDTIGAHVFSYELHYGPIDRNKDGSRAWHVMHLCDHRACVNPNHLVLGTDMDNRNDSVSKGRHFHKLNPEDVVEIRRLYGLGDITQAQLGKQFNVHPETVGHILRRTTWKHL